MDLQGKLLLAFIFIILHEFSHYLIAKKMGSNIVNFKIHPLGATLEIEDYEGIEINDEILICLAGPLFNIIISIIALIFMMIYDDLFFKNVLEVNLVLGILNLMPAHPLDGAKILRALLSKVYMYKKAHKIVMVVSFICSTSILAVGVMLVPKGISNINIIVLGVFMIYTTYSTKERTMYIVLDQIIKKNNRFKQMRYIENRDVSVYFKEDFLKLLSMVERDKFNTFHVLNENMEYLYDIREDEVVEILKTKGNMSLEKYNNIRLDLDEVLTKPEC